MIMVQTSKTRLDTAARTLARIAAQRARVTGMLADHPQRRTEERVLRSMLRNAAAVGLSVEAET